MTNRIPCKKTAAETWAGWYSSIRFKNKSLNHSLLCLRGKQNLERVRPTRNLGSASCVWSPGSTKLHDVSLWHCIFMHFSRHPPLPAVWPGCVGRGSEFHRAGLKAAWKCGWKDRAKITSLSWFMWENHGLTYLMVKMRWKHMKM